ncbi:MAG TPA: alpha/beta fold hydrolase [Thermoanaerobaculia bacterium]|nr:alpha/beta fold hydrolase [Thermoanaerobaculia bacterium]
MTLHREIHGAGEPFVLLNGIMMTTASWALQLPALVPHFRCILHDFKGQLRSPSDEPSWTIESHADDLRDLLDGLDLDRVHVAGTSYGGEVGMIFAYMYPERVKSLTVIASTSRADDRMKRGAAGARDLALREPERLFDAVAPSFYSPEFIAAHPELIEQGRARLATFPRSFFEGYAKLCDAFGALDITKNLQGITCPALVIAAERDTLKPLACSRTIAENIGGARLEIVADAGHAVVIEKPQDVNRLVSSFLRC